MSAKQEKAKRKFHHVHSVSHNIYKFHCVECDQYFMRGPSAATCKPIPRATLTEQEKKQAPPIHPFEVRISIGGDDWKYVRRAIEQIADYINERDPENCSCASGGGGGSYSVSTSQRDVTAEQFHAELETWRQGQ